MTASNETNETIRVHIPSALYSYTSHAAIVQARGSTVDEVLRDLDRQFPGIRFRIADEQDRIRRHLKLFVGPEQALDTRFPLNGHGEIDILMALSGG